MKVLFVNDQFERGGAGRVSAILCNELYKRGYNVTVVADTLNWNETYHLNRNIQICQIVTKTVKWNKYFKWIKCIHDIRRFIKGVNPDVLIASQAFMYLCVYVANKGIGCPIIVADHTSFNRKQGFLLDYVRFHLYNKAEGLSILTQRDNIILGERFPNKMVIYNPLSFPVSSLQTTRRKNILCAGRLEVWHIKGFDIILEIWKHLCDRYPDWVLEIAGDGTAQSIVEINEMIIKKKLQDRVVLLGHVNNMQRLYSESSIFALPSRIEGFPMVLMEAMSQGCACITFDFGGASKEMVHGSSAIVVDDGDIQKFEDSLVNLLDKEDCRKQMANLAINSVSRFTVESFVNNWEELIHLAISRGQKDRPY